MNFNNAKFIKSAPSFLLSPDEIKKEIIIIGKSNVGKSSLINALTGNKSLAFSSAKPGHTKLLNYFLLDNSFYLLDSPGYGFTLKGGHKLVMDFGIMMEEYFHNSKCLKGVIFLLDSRRVPNEDDVLFYNFLKSTHVPFCLVLTKADKLNQKEKARIRKNLENKINDEDISKMILVSNKNPSSINILKDQIVKLLD